MLVLLLIIFTLFTSPVFASSSLEVNIQSLQSKVGVGNTFPIVFNIKNNGDSNSFYYKFIGGIGESTSQIQTFKDGNFYSDGSSWPNFSSVSLDTGSSATISGFAKVCSNCPGGQYNLKIRVALTSNTSGLWSTTPITSFTVPSSCVYEYSSWGSCDSSNNQTRVVNSYTPSDCEGTPILSQSCTYDSTVVNPISGISLTEFMSYSSIEWIELYNNNDYDVKLVAWKIEDSSANTRNISELTIKSKSYATYDFTLLLNNSDSDKLILYNQDQKIIDSYQYPTGKFDLEKSWSKNDNNWCQTNLSKGQSNYQCYSAPTSTPTSTPIPTTAPTNEPIKETPSIEPTPIITEDTSTPSTSSGLILGDSSLPVKQNFLPIILIFGGAILLLSPLIISKLKKS